MTDPVVEAVLNAMDFGEVRSLASAIDAAECCQHRAGLKGELEEIRGLTKALYEEALTRLDMLATLARGEEW